MYDIKPKVSVIIPNYNHACYLNERINSVLNQTFQDFELIILDDCSADNSVQIIAEYEKNEHVSHVVLNQINSGSTFKQWSKGFSLAKGEYVWIAESDDYAAPTFLERLVALLDADPMNVLAFCPSFIVDEHSNILDENRDKIKDTPFGVKHFVGSDFVRDKMLPDDCIYNSSMAIFRRSCLSRIDREFTFYRYCGDWLFWIQISLLGNVIRYNEKLNYFRQHSAKVSPRSDADGTKYLEGKKVVAYALSQLELTDMQRKVIIGRVYRHVLRFKLFENDEIRNKVIKDVSQFLHCNRYYTWLYMLDKVFNFSKLELRKRKYK